jgi:hypothetical protein
MCITSGPAVLSKTRILSFKVDENKHFLSYSNSAKNLSNKPNAMILPVPGTVKQSDFVDTTAFPKFMEHLEEALTPRQRGGSFLGGQSKGIDLNARRITHFQSGMYEVFIAAGGTGPALVGMLQGKKHPVQEALKVLQPSKRPEISKELLEWYDKFYPGWDLVVCVFGADKVMESQPIAFTYRPLPEWKDALFYPAVDSHSGGIPDLNEDVDVDHFLFAPSSRGATIPSQSSMPKYLLARTFNGVKQNDHRSNGDWIRPVDESLADTRLIGGMNRVSPEMWATMDSTSPSYPIVEYFKDRFQKISK